MASVESDTSKIRRERERANWGERETFSLLEIYKPKAYSIRFRKINVDQIYKEMALRLLRLGYQRSPKEVRNKIQNLNQRYRLENRKIHESGGEPSSWRFYSKLHGILGNLPALDPIQIREKLKADEECEPVTDEERSTDVLIQAMDTDENNSCEKVEDQNLGPSTSKKSSGLKDIEDTAEPEKASIRVENAYSLRKRRRITISDIKNHVPQLMKEKSHDALREIIKNQERMMKFLEAQNFNLGTIIKILANHLNVNIAGTNSRSG